MAQLAEQFFNLEIALQVWPLMLRGLGMTLLLCALIIPLGITGGLFIAIAGTSNSPFARVLTRSTPTFFALFRHWCC